MWFKNKKKEQIEELQRQKIAESQMALLSAASSTAEAANNVTHQLRKRLEETIEQFEETSKIINDGLIIIESNGKIRYINNAAELMFGINLQNAKDKNVEILFDIKDINDFYIKANDNDIIGLRSNSERFKTNIKFKKLMRSDDDNVVLIALQDMTDENLISEEHRKIKSKYLTLFNSYIDGVIIVQEDNIVAANDMIENIFNEKLENKKIKLYLQEVPDSSQISVRSSNIDLLITGTPIIWNDKPATLLTVKDVSELKRIETAFLARANNGIDMIVCCDVNFNITFVNEAFCNYMNMSREQIINTNINNVFTEEEKAAFIITVTLLSPENSSRRVQISTNNGTKIVDWIEYAIFSDDGKIIEYQRTGRDISELFLHLSSKSSIH